MRTLIIASVVLVTFITLSANLPSTDVSPCQKYINIIKADSIQFLKLNRNYKAALKDIEALKEQNNTLDSIITVKENDIHNMHDAYDRVKKNIKIQVSAFDSLIHATQDSLVMVKKELKNLSGKR